MKILVLYFSNYTVLTPSPDLSKGFRVGWHMQHNEEPLLKKDFDITGPVFAGTLLILCLLRVVLFLFGIDSSHFRRLKRKPVN